MMYCCFHSILTKRSSGKELGPFISLGSRGLCRSAALRRGCCCCAAAAAAAAAAVRGAEAAPGTAPAPRPPLNARRPPGPIPGRPG